MSEDILKTPRKRRVANSAVEDKPGKNNERTLKVEVSKYKAIDNILESNLKTKRVLFLVFFLSLFLFVGITVIAFSFKKLYSYSDVTTNGLGATTFKSEKSEVSYWLYNTAQLWANSGITVKEGDIISVRSSGKFHTAIHHLYDDVKNNSSLRDKWVGSEGEEDNSNKKSSYLRRKYRMFPDLPTGALVMQVSVNKPFDSSSEKGADPSNFYFIGKERDNIYIKNPGTLYFSLNDIILSESVIKRMVNDALIYGLEDEKTKQNYDETMKLRYKSLNNDTPNNIPLETLFNDFKTIFKRQIEGTEGGSRKISVFEMGITKISANRLKGGPHKDCLTNDSKIDFNLLNKVYKTAVPEGETIAKVFELEYYYKNNYKTAWFDDNLGSFLIVIEKNTSK